MDGVFFGHLSLLREGEERSISVDNFKADFVVVDTERERERDRDMAMVVGGRGIANTVDKARLHSK